MSAASQPIHGGYDECRIVRPSIDGLLIVIRCRVLVAPLYFDGPEQNVGQGPVGAYRFRGDQLIFRLFQVSPIATVFHRFLIRHELGQISHRLGVVRIVASRRNLLNLVGQPIGGCHVQCLLSGLQGHDANRQLTRRQLDRLQEVFQPLGVGFDRDTEPPEEEVHRRPLCVTDLTR